MAEGKEPRTVVYYDVGELSADVVTIDALARLQLAFRRSGCELRMRNASMGLLELVGFVGLDAVLRS